MYREAPMPPAYVTSSNSFMIDLNGLLHVYHFILHIIEYACWFPLLLLLILLLLLLLILVIFLLILPQLVKRIS